MDGISDWSGITLQVQQPQRFGGGQSIDFDDLRARLGACYNPNGSPRHSEALAEKINQGVVRRAIHRRRRQAHLERVAMQSGDFSAGRAWLHVYGESNSALPLVYSHRVTSRAGRLVERVYTGTIMNKLLNQKKR